MKNYTYVALNPSGNITAFVLGLDYSQKERKIISQSILLKNTQIEQVGFINPNTKHPELQMAGGEFCGNALRAAAYYYLDAKPGSILIRMSGVNQPLNAGINKDGRARAEMPLDNISICLGKKKNRIVVRMPGIVHIICSQKTIRENGDIDKLKYQARKIIKDEHVEQNDAVGVMFCKEKEVGLSILPIVWVREIDTLYFEMACGSGSYALGLVEAQKKGKSLVLLVEQPSGSAITVTITYRDMKYLNATIAGEVVMIASA